MSNTVFAMSFAHGQIPSTPFNGEEPVLLPTTTCTITDEEGEVIAEETVVPYHTTVDNRVYARRFAFEKAVNQIQHKETRRILWQIYRNAYRQADKKNPPVRIRTIEALLKRFPGIHQDDYTALAAQVRAVLAGAKRLRNLDYDTEQPAIAKVSEEIPNTEPMGEVA